LWLNLWRPTSPKSLEMLVMVFLPIATRDVEFTTRPLCHFFRRAFSLVWAERVDTCRKNLQYNYNNIMHNSNLIKFEGRSWNQMTKIWTHGQIQMGVLKPTCTVKKQAYAWEQIWKAFQI
jgi:hypothetical protein